MESKVIKIIYASTSGNVELVAEQVAFYLGESKIEVSLHRAEMTDVSIFDDAQFFIMAASTWEHGELNPFFHKLHLQMQNYDFQGKKAAFIGLGDFRYEPVMFNVAIDQLRDTFTKNKGEPVGKILKINGDPHAILTSTVKVWSEEISKLLV